jgi:hypothetical protein
VANKARGRDGLPGRCQLASAGVGPRQTALIFLSGGAHHRRALHRLPQPVNFKNSLWIQWLASRPAGPRMAGTLSAERRSSAEKCSPSNPTTFRRITMKTLIIKDLARTEQLDRSVMAGVRGGTKMSTASAATACYPSGAANHSPSYDSSLTATQNMVQMQDVVNATANGSAFIDGVHANNTTSLCGQNNIVRL